MKEGATVVEIQEWEGRLQVPGLGNLLVTVDQLGGLGNIGSFFPSGEAEIRGRVGNDKLEPFFEDLKSSRSRTVSLGIVRCSTEGDHATMEEVRRQICTLYVDLNFKLLYGLDLGHWNLSVRIAGSA